MRQQNNKQDITESTNEPIKVVLPFSNLIEAVECVQNIGFLLSLADGDALEQLYAQNIATELNKTGNFIFQLSEQILFGIDKYNERFIALNEITANNPAIIAMNLPFTTTENQLKTILSLLNFNAPLSPLSEVDQINLQITLEANDE